MKLYNTLTRKVEEFTPMNGKKVNFFVCGPTVYDLSHLGHAKTYIQMDTLARTLRALDYEVFYLQNITDIDDKIIARAEEKGESWKELSHKFEAKYFEDMKSLNVTSVSKYAKATDYIDNIIRQVQTLLDKGHAYIIEDGIYFEIKTFPGYGKLSGRTEVKKDDAQTRIDHSDEKRGWNDFCVWKFSKPDEPVWEAPFGKGRPGWHIEDTAISEHFFGPQYDIHGGAVDLIFPHHEAEITQMESISGKEPFVRYWTHVGFLNINSAKMAKSTGNFFTIRDVLAKGYDPMAIRLLMLQSHYRSAVNFSWDELDAAQNRLKTYQAMADLRWQTTETSSPGSTLLADTKLQVITAMSNDLDAPEALAHLSKLESQWLRLLSESKESIDQFLQFLDSIFGLELRKGADINDEQSKFLNDYEAARQAKDWQTSDKLRERLKAQGLGVRDTDLKSIWFRV